MAVARGVATVKPDKSHLFKLSNFGPDMVIIWKGCIVAFVEPHAGQLLVALTEETDPPIGPVFEKSRNALKEADLSGAPEHLHKQIKGIVAKHGKIWGGTLGVIHATEHAIVTPPSTAPVRSQPYRTASFKRATIEDQISKVLKLKSESQRLGQPRRHRTQEEWESPVLRR